MNVSQQLTVEFGSIKPYPETTFYYDGDDDSGVKIIIEAQKPASGIRINRTSGSEYIRIDPARFSAIAGSDIKAHDRIEIDTHKGKKSAKLYRDGNEINILHAIISSPQWIHLERGYNKFTYTATSGVDSLKIYMEYAERVNGV